MEPAAILRRVHRAVKGGVKGKRRRWSNGKMKYWSNGMVE
jgi:hypothetical protein